MLNRTAARYFDTQLLCGAPIARLHRKDLKTLMYFYRIEVKVKVENESETTTKDPRAYFTLMFLNQQTFKGCTFIITFMFCFFSTFHCT